MNLNDTVFSKAWAQQYVFKYCHGFWHISPQEVSSTICFQLLSWILTYFPPICFRRFYLTSPAHLPLKVIPARVSSFTWKLWTFKKYWSKNIITRCRSSFLSYLGAAIQMIIIQDKCDHQEVGQLTRCAAIWIDLIRACRWVSSMVVWLKFDIKKKKSGPRSGLFRGKEK